LTKNVLECVVAPAAQVSSIETAHQETPSPINPLGVTGIGEPVIAAAPPAHASAVLNALGPSGVHHLDMTSTPVTV